MRLKCIRLAGFKSFVDPTTVPFTKNMTCVVGPNGCGKSNIIDAVRWVMGESSAKHLRGESMTDVIFNGSTARKPVGQASIELVFDNSDGTLKGQFGQYAEIALKRQVTREGQSSYYLNGTKCRRKDITEIFLGTGLGSRSYAIIEQGMISRLIEAKPEELRNTIEEAAGISKYKERRRETENRMRRTHENLERLHDIRDELERQLQRLQRQADAAHRYRELKAQERRLKGQLRAIRWRDLDVQIRQYAAVISDLEIRSEKHLFALRRAESEIEESRQQHQESNEQLEQFQASFYELGNQISRLEQQMSHQKQRGQQLHTDLLDVDRQIQENHQEQQQDKERLQDVLLLLDELEPEFEMQQEASEALEMALEEAEENVQQWQHRWDSFNQKDQQYRRDAELAQSNIQQHERSLNDLRQRHARVHDQLSGLEAPEEDDEELELMQETALEFELQLESLEEEAESQKDTLQTCREELNDGQKEREQLQGQQQIHSGRLASLQALQEAALADDDPVQQRWLARQGLSEAPKLAEQLEVKPRWAQAVETVLDAQLQGLTCKQLQLPELAQGLSEQAAQKDERADFTFIASDYPQPQLANGVAKEQTLAAQVSVASGQLPERLLQVIIVDSVESGVQRLAQLPLGYSVITEQGVWLGHGWLRYHKGNTDAAGVLNRARDIEQLELDIEAGRERLAELDATLDQLKSRQQDLENRSGQIADQRMSVQRQKSEWDGQIRTRQLKQEQFNERQRHLNEELAQIRKREEEEQSLLEEARENWQLALEQVEAFTEEREHLQADRNRTKEVYEQKRQAVRLERDKLHQLALRRQELSGQKQLAEKGIERIEQQLERLREKREDLLMHLEDVQEPKEDSELLLDELIERKAEEEQKLMGVREKAHQLNDAMRQLEKSRTEHERDLERVRTELEKMRMQQQALSVQREGINEQLDEIGGDLDDLLNGLPEEATANSWQEQQNDVSEKIKRLGAINLAAIEEYEAQLERKQYLDAQHDELTEALGMLENAIRKIDKETRQRFKQTFDEVNGWLQRLFPKVFGGGSAWLALTGDDLLETGVSIMARPPGKKNSTIHLLSGGEKALTAIALVFSIFQLNPAPFCMLDEVDAPLDDANVGRYANIVKEMSEHLQFIYISHNKIAMEMADHLMGVTMQEPGVSRIVAVDIDEATALVDV